MNHPYRTAAPPEEKNQEEVRVDPRLIKPHWRLFKLLFLRWDSYWILNDEGFRVKVPWGD